MKAAVFVDSGYLYESCALAHFGRTVGRNRYQLDIPKAVERVTKLARDLDGGGLNVIRIYWYDAAHPYRPQWKDHSELAKMNDIKLRLGDLMQRDGGTWEQKGVDALIIHDICELSENRAIDTALLVSGDADLVLGVTTAQSYGVRVHLLGLGNTAHRLQQEADVFHRWDPLSLKGWVVAIDDANKEPKRSRTDVARPQMNVTIGSERMLEVARHVLSDLNSEIDILSVYEASNSFPPDVEVALMRRLAVELRREPNMLEKTGLRAAFFAALKAIRDTAERI